MPNSLTRRHAFFAFSALCAVRPAPGAQEQMWKSEPPSDCPFEPSHSFKGVAFMGRHSAYTEADTWYPSWASDGKLYSPWTDGKVNGLQSTSAGRKATTGHATILGDDPLRLEVVDQAVYAGDPAPYGGRYPCGSLVHNGVWYYGTYCLMDTDGNPSKGLNWDILGPFVGFRYSKDFGKTWTDTPHTPSKPLFGEPAKPGGKVSSKKQQQQPASARETKNQG